MNDIIERLDIQRKFYCTGPCGQSQSVLRQRSAADAVFKDAMSEIKNLQYALKVRDKLLREVNSLYLNGKALNIGRTEAHNLTMVPISAEWYDKSYEVAGE